MVKHTSRPLVLLCVILGVFFHITQDDLFVVHAWSPSGRISRLISNRVVAEKRRQFELEAQSSSALNDSNRRRWWRFGRSSNDEERANPAMRSIKKAKAKTRAAKPMPEPGKSKWDMMKRVVYGTVDAVSSLPSRIRGGKGNKQNSVLDEGYSSLETTLLSLAASRESPGQRILKIYQERSLPISKSEVKEEPTARDLFDGFKEGVYNAAASVGSVLESGRTSSTGSTQQTVSQNFKPVTKTTLSRSREVQQALPGLKSTNPVTKWTSEQRIVNWELAQQKRQAQDVPSTLDTVKGSVFQITDTIQSFFRAVMSIPSKVSNAAEATRDMAWATVEWVASFPTAVESLSATIAGIPEEIERKVTEVQNSINGSIQASQRMVQDVQAIPGRIQTSIGETQQRVDDAIYNVKVLAGMAERKPHPPKTPPPKPHTTEELLWEISGAVAKETAKAAWWAGTGVAKLSLKGAQLALAAAAEKMKEEQARTKVADTKQIVSAFVSPMDGTKKPQVEIKMETPAMATATEESQDTASFKTIVNDDLPNSERELGEISEALKLAQKAIAMSDEGGTTKKGRGGSELDQALQRAKDAALIATREAVEIEKTLNRMP